MSEYLVAKIKADAIRDMIKAMDSEIYVYDTKIETLDIKEILQYADNLEGKWEWEK